MPLSRLPVNLSDLLSLTREYNRSAGARGVTRTQVVVGVAVFVAFLVLLSPLVLISISRGKAERTLAEKIEELEAAGITVALEELNRRYAYPPEEENAALVFEKAFSRVEVPDDARDELPPWSEEGWPELGEPVPEKWAPAVRELLEVNAEAIAFFHEGARLPEARYEADFTHGFAVLIPHAGRLREGARLFSFAAVWHASQGEWEEAASSIETLFAIGRSLREEPILISQLTRIAISSIGCDAIQRVLAAGDVSPEFLVRVQAVLEREARDALMMRRGLEGELAFGIHAFELVKRDPKAIAEFDDGMDTFADALGWGYWFSGFLARDEILFLDIMTDFLDAYGDPLPERLDSIPSGAEIDRRVDDAFPASIVSGIMIPTMGRVIESEAIALARARAVLTLVAAERFRLDRERLPRDLEELTPDYFEQLPSDPFTGAPFGVRMEEEWLILSSEGKIRDEPLELRLPVER